ncbi:MAG TPA: 16S rRNA methyltransferase [Archaeoglobus profundus]|nr:16S rRNA methyltransferase [Archaeoglobus profundus]
MLKLVFLDTSLELVPPNIAKHPAIVKDARRRKKKPTRIILDDSKHHLAMKDLRNREKRGRPDIIHQCLLSVLDSRASKYIDIYVHTIDGKIIWINNKTRLPRNYNRFIGLMEDLFDKKEIKANGEVLLKILKVDLRYILKDADMIVVLTENGEKDEEILKDVFKLKNPAVCIGAFPHGDFEEDTMNVLKSLNAEFVALSKEPLTSLYITNRVICIYENERVLPHKVG